MLLSKYYTITPLIDIWLTANIELVLYNLHDSLRSVDFVNEPNPLSVDLHTCSSNFNFFKHLYSVEIQIVHSFDSWLKYGTSLACDTNSTHRLTLSSIQPVTTILFYAYYGNKLKQLLPLYLRLRDNSVMLHEFSPTLVCIYSMHTMVTN